MCRIHHGMEEPQHHTMLTTHREGGGGVESILRLHIVQ